MLEFGVSGGQDKKRKQGKKSKLRRGLKDVLDPETHYPADNPRRCLEVIEEIETGCIVGTVGFSALNRDLSVFELKRFYLRPDHRGKGLGLQLFERRLRAIALLNPSKVVTTIAAPLAANLHLHESHGFVVRNGVTHGRNKGERLCVWTRETTSIDSVDVTRETTSIDSADVNNKSEATEGRHQKPNDSMTEQQPDRKKRKPNDG